MGSSGGSLLSSNPKQINKEMENTDDLVLTPQISRSLPQLCFVGRGWRFKVESVETHLKKTAFTVEITRQQSARDWLIQIWAFNHNRKKNILQEDENVIELPLTFSDPLDVQLAHVWHCWFLPILFLHLVRPHPLRYRVAPEVCNESSSENRCQTEKGEEMTSVHFFHLGFNQGGLHACLWGWPPGKGDQL